MFANQNTTAPTTGQRVPDPVPQRSFVKMPKPASFNGSRGKTHSFLQLLALYFKGTLGIAKDQKVSFTLSLMDSGAAARWRDQMIQLQDNFTANPMNPNTVIPPSSFVSICEAHTGLQPQ